MKIFIGSATWRTEETGYSQSMRLLHTELQARGIPMTDNTVVGDALVSRARSIIASAFLRSDADVLLSIDTDIWFRPQDAITLCEQAGGKDIISALYMTRNMNTQPALMLPPDEDVLFSQGSPPVEVPFGSTGFMAVHRRVFEKLSEDLPLCHKGWTDRGANTSFWPFYMPYPIPWDGDGHMYLSEDWAFCQRARDAGFQVWLDPGIRLGHIGSYMYTLEDLIRPDRPAAQPLVLRRAQDGQLQVGTLQEKPLVPAADPLPQHPVRG